MRALRFVAGLTMLAAPVHAAPDAGPFVLHDADGGAKSAHGSKSSQIKATRTEAAMKFFILDKEKGPIKGIVVALTGPDGTTFSTDETDAAGYAEVLVPVGRKYDVAYLRLGQNDIATSVTVSDEPNQNIKLTLRYKPMPPPPPFVLKGVTFDTGRATIRPESLSMLDIVVDFMKRKKSARVEVSGHTDNKGNAKKNKVLSEQRARACRDYLIAHGIDGERIKAVGFGGEQPMAPNDSDENRQKNRRIEVKEIVPPG